MGNGFKLVWTSYHPTPDHLVFHLTTSPAMSRMTRIVSQKHVFGRAYPAKGYRYLSTFHTSKSGCTKLVYVLHAVFAETLTRRLTANDVCKLRTSTDLGSSKVRSS